jgi:hypothetical protein
MDLNIYILGFSFKTSLYWRFGHALNINYLIYTSYLIIIVIFVQNPLRFKKT